MANFDVGEKVQLVVDAYDWDGGIIPAGTSGTITSQCFHAIPSMYGVDFGPKGRHVLHDFQLAKIQPPVTSPTKQGDVRQAISALKEKGVRLTEIIFALAGVYPEEYHEWNERNTREVIELFEEERERK